MLNWSHKIMKKEQFKKNGFSLLELVAAIGILTVFIFTFTTNVTQIIEESKLPTLTDMKKRLSLKSVSTRILARNHWVWNMDTDAPQFGGPNDPAILWSEIMTNYFDINRVTTSVNFQKRSGNEYVEFDSLPFDGNEPRDTAVVTVTVYFEDDTSASQNIYIKSAPTQAGITGVMLTLRDAIMMYNDDNGMFPASLDLLVPTYLDEVPNNPLTAEHEKVTNIEELSDWGYSTNGAIANLWPRTNPDMVGSFMGQLIVPADF
jgi:hypothetical protein